jgi:PAS domain S-box-containing protein
MGRGHADDQGDVELRVRTLESLVAAQAKAIEAVEASRSAMLETALDAVISMDQDGHILDFNPAAERMFGRRREDVLGLEVGATIVPASLRARHFRGLAHYERTGRATVMGRRIELTGLHANGTEFPLEIAITRVGQGTDHAFTAYLRDLTERKLVEGRMERLALALEQTAEIVILADAAGRIEYVNPAFEAATGGAAGEALGTPLLAGAAIPLATVQAIKDSLAEGRSWTGDRPSLRSDGSIFAAATVISPVRDTTGTVTGYVATARDVTRERASLAREEQHARERTLIAEALEQITSGAGAEETADAICRQVVRLPDVFAAWLVSFDPDGRAQAIGVAKADGGELERRQMPGPRSRVLRIRAAEGPWVETWKPVRGHPYTHVFTAAGVKALAFAPLRVRGAARGLLVVASAAPDAITQLAERVPALMEFAAMASAIVAPIIDARASLVRLQSQIRSAIERRAFSPVYQPIVALTERQLVGYEALTRFSDRAAAAERFASAWSVGLGLELESATLEAALVGAKRLDPGLALHINVSPALVLSGELLQSILARHAVSVVLEITEHEAIDDYAAFRAAADRLGASTVIAVDDAGAGFASFRHILEIRPAIVKLDRSLVAGIDVDPTRQALVAGMRHFVDAASIRLIAEGIETEAEVAALLDLGVTTGQGYLLGRPGPL